MRTALQAWVGFAVMHSTLPCLSKKKHDSVPQSVGQKHPHRPSRCYSRSLCRNRLTTGFVGPGRGPFYFKASARPRVGPWQPLAPRCQLTAALGSATQASSASRSSKKQDQRYQRCCVLGDIRPASGNVSTLLASAQVRSSAPLERRGEGVTRLPHGLGASTAERVLPGSQAAGRGLIRWPGSRPRPAVWEQGLSHRASGDDSGPVAGAQPGSCPPPMPARTDACEGSGSRGHLKTG